MRAVMGIAERMPELGTRFYDTGPCFSRASSPPISTRRVAAGQLDIPDTLLAAAQFLEMSHCPVLKPMLSAPLASRRRSVSPRSFAPL